MMDWLSFSGNIASLFGAAFSLYQARRAKDAAQDAISAKNDLLNHRKISELSQILSNCKQCANALAKYGPAASPSSILGASIEKDAEQIQNLILNLREHQFHFEKKDSKENPSKAFCNRLESLLPKLVGAKSQKKQKEYGSQLLHDLSNFVALTRHLIEQSQIA